MKKIARKIVASDAAKTKRLMTHCASRNERTRRRTANLQTTLNIYSPNHIGWYQFRKRANQRLRNLSDGKLVIDENGYRGDHERHLLKCQEPACGNVFHASIREVRLIGANKICPYCNIPDDMSRYGSIESLQEHVLKLSLANAYIYADTPLDNSIKPEEPEFRFLCLIHDHAYTISMIDFAEKAGRTNGCGVCEGYY